MRKLLSAISAIVLANIGVSDASIYMPQKTIYKCHTQYGFDLQFHDFEKEYGEHNQGQYLVQCPSKLIIDGRSFDMGAAISFKYHNSKINSSCVSQEKNIESCSIYGRLYAEKKHKPDVKEYRQSRLWTTGKLDTGFEFACNYWFENTSFQISFEFDPETYDDNLDCSPPETIMEEMKKHVRHLPPEETETP